MVKAVLPSHASKLKKQIKVEKKKRFGGQHTLSKYQIEVIRNELKQYYKLHCNNTDNRTTWWIK